MIKSDIIYTQENNCQDCYKCIRACPVKAISIENHSASVISELCIYCGLCTEICPVQAKKVRNGINVAKMLIDTYSKVIVSLAPAFASEFDDITTKQLIKALKQLGFYGVSETAIGADIVSHHTEKYLQTSKESLISTACPAVVQYVCKYYPERKKNLLPIVSPMLAHANLLKKTYGEDVRVIFIGPCVAKMAEADEFNKIVDLALTFNDLRTWFENEKIDFHKVETKKEDKFIPFRAKKGAEYPVDGGMLTTIKKNASFTDKKLMAFSGMNHVKQVLEHFDELSKDQIFFELMACDGGCINGPGTQKEKSVALKKLQIIQSLEEVEKIETPDYNININQIFNISQPQTENYTEIEIAEALQSIGKQSEKDKLNCSGCGYDTCRDFAKALLNGTADSSMCVSYNRRVADNKATALLQRIPSGVVLVDENLIVLEANKMFAKILGEDIEDLFEFDPGLKNADLRKLVGFHKLFDSVLNSEEGTIERDIREGKKLLKVSVFNVQPRRIACGIIRDMHVPEVRKEEIINRTKDVIKNNLETVQKIAYLLGENASSTEQVLNSIIQSYYGEEKHEK